VDALEEIHRRRSDPSGIASCTGRQIGRYLVGQQLGSGGVAAVYRAYDQVEGQTVALKLLLPGADEKSYIRLRNEAMTAGSLRHPHLVRILQIGTAAQGEVAYIAMELVEGVSLAELLHQRGRLRPAESANLLEPIARALAAAHAQGIVHRDVKPSNLLLRTVSPGAAHSVQIEALDHPVVPLLTDFGIARALDAPELTSVGRTVGTPAYMAPEQCTRSREIDGRADLYALGAVLYRSLAGRPPFVGATPQILHAHVYEPVTIEEEVYRQLSPLLVEVLQRSLAKLPEERFANANELADALAKAAGRTQRGVRAGNGGTATATLTMAALPSLAPPADPTVQALLVPGSGARSVHPLRRAAEVLPTETQGIRAARRERVGLRGRASGRAEQGSALGRALLGGVSIVALGVLLGIVAPRLWDLGKDLATQRLPAAALLSPTPEGGGRSAEASNSFTEPLAVPANELLVVPVWTPAATDVETEGCTQRIDEILQQYSGGLPEERRTLLGCPRSVAQVGAAQMLPFEFGYMVGLDRAPEIYIVYLRDDRWEWLPAVESPSLPAELSSAVKEGNFLPGGRFAGLWAQDGRWQKLGFAVAPAPVAFTAAIQTFEGAVLIADRETAEVAWLPLLQR
jgi:serine/threonine-protein kinase